jgi:hypothetical protein
MGTKRLVIVGAVLLLAILGAVFFQKVHYVDPKPAVALGEEYFSKLKESQMDDAFAMYTDGFLRERGEDWQKLVTQLDTEKGAVTDFKTLGWQVAPVTLRDSTEIPCVVVRYQVARNSLISEEGLTICPHQRGDDWGIAGHKITRSDTGQHFEAGITFQEKTIFRTN